MKSMMRRTWAMALATGLMTLALGACGGGGGGGGAASDGAQGGATGGTGSAGNTGTASPDYSKVQPPSAPASEAYSGTRVTGTVVVSADTQAAAGRQAGVPVSLHWIAADGSVGAALKSTMTGADGRFTIDMPLAGATDDGDWLLMAASGGIELRAYVHPGDVRLDISSELWVRIVAASAGRLLSFPKASIDRLRSIERSLGLYADAVGADLANTALADAPARLLAGLAQDHALNHIAATLRATGALPAGGLGDIGGFFALSSAYAVQTVDKAGLVTLTRAANAAGGKDMTADGYWTLQLEDFRRADGSGDWTSAGNIRAIRMTPEGLFAALPGGTGVAQTLANLVGVFGQSSLPLQPGARLLDTRRFDKTGLNFTGGSDDQPMAFGSAESVGALTTVEVGGVTRRAIPLVTTAEFIIPSAEGGTRRYVLRTTQWMVPGLGVARDLDELLQDGVVVPDSSGASSRLQAAVVDDVVWPGRVAIRAAGSGSGGADPADATMPAVPAPNRVLAVDLRLGRALLYRDDTRTLSAAGLSSDGSVDLGSLRAIRGGVTFAAAVWFLGGERIVLQDGSSLMWSDGSAGPVLAQSPGWCGLREGLLTCLDPARDSLVRYSQDTLAQTASVALASDIRVLAGGIDFRAVGAAVPGDFRLIDAKTVIVRGWQLSVADW